MTWGSLWTSAKGRRFQLEAGLPYDWHRYYDPPLERYNQPDRLLDAD